MHLSSTSIDFAKGVLDALEKSEVYRPGIPLSGGVTYLIGNGGSAAVCAHIANDMVKRGLMASTLDSPAIVTCLANDIGYENVFAHQLLQASVEDTLIIVSSSGRSKNLLNAADSAKKSGMYIATLTGFDPDNPLRQLGHTNYYVPSHNYGIVEIAHLTILHSLVNPGM